MPGAELCRGQSRFLGWLQLSLTQLFSRGFLPLQLQMGWGLHVTLNGGGHPPMAECDGHFDGDATLAYGPEAFP